MAFKMKMKEYGKGKNPIQMKGDTPNKFLGGLASKLIPGKAGKVVGGLLNPVKGIKNLMQKRNAAQNNAGGGAPGGNIDKEML